MKILMTIIFLTGTLPALAQGELRVPKGLLKAGKKPQNELLARKRRKKFDCVAIQLRGFSQTIG